MTKTGVEYADEQISIYPAPCTYACRYCWARLPIWRYRLKNPHPIREANRLARSKKRAWIPGITDPLEIIKATHEFVDWFVIGRLDYETHLGYQKIPKGWYRSKLLAVIDMLEALGKPYHIKKQLKENP